MEILFSTRNGVELHIRLDHLTTYCTVWYTYISSECCSWRVARNQLLTGSKPRVFTCFEQKQLNAFADFMQNANDSSFATVYECLPCLYAYNAKRLIDLIMMKLETHASFTTMSNEHYASIVFESLVRRGVHVSDTMIQRFNNTLIHENSHTAHAPYLWKFTFSDALPGINISLFPLRMLLRCRGLIPRYATAAVLDNAIKLKFLRKLKKYRRKC